MSNHSPSAWRERLTSPLTWYFAGVAVLSVLTIGLAMVIGHEIWSGGLLPVVVTLLGWIITVRSAALLAFSPDTIEAFYDTLRYEERFYIYMGGTLILGLYLTIAGLVG